MLIQIVELLYVRHAEYDEMRNKNLHWFSKVLKCADRNDKELKWFVNHVVSVTWLQVYVILRGKLIVFR